jgi:hypothetical protein
MGPIKYEQPMRNLAVMQEKTVADPFVCIVTSFEQRTTALV